MVDIIIQDVDVVNQFNTGSDYRIIKCKVFINIKIEKKNEKNDIKGKKKNK